jgi:hypothetical protein
MELVILVTRVTRTTDLWTINLTLLSPLSIFVLKAAGNGDLIMWGSLVTLVMLVTQVEVMLAQPMAAGIAVPGSAAAMELRRTMKTADCQPVCLLLVFQPNQSSMVKQVLSAVTAPSILEIVVRPWNGGVAALLAP